MSFTCSPFMQLRRSIIAQNRVTSFGYHYSGQVRWQSSYAPLPTHLEHPAPAFIKPNPPSQSSSPVTRLSTWSLIRTLILGTFLTRPMLLKPGLWVMQKVADSESRLLNPDRNLILRALIKPVVYDHFCAGTHRAEIQQTIQSVRNLGFKGVILCYNKEIQVSKDNKFLGAQRSRDNEIQDWRKSTLETVDMLDGGNFLGIKMTGAGQEVTEALVKGEEPPAEFAEAMDAICERVRDRKCRIWVDSEQQAVQPSIDRWTIGLMQKFNRGSDTIVYNTVQAYLKESRHKLKRQMELSLAGSWNLGIKLVRGAYIAHDKRSLIHDTKGDTDASYNGIVHDMMAGSFESFGPDQYGHVKLFLAGHNEETVRYAMQLGQELASSGQLKVRPEFGQLQGMADSIGCEIIAEGERVEAEKQQRSDLVQKNPGQGQEPFVPFAYKCLHWGSVQECMQYLVRRAVENSAAVARIKDGTEQARRELFRRMKSKVLN